MLIFPSLLHILSCFWLKGNADLNLPSAMCIHDFLNLPELHLVACFIVLAAPGSFGPKHHFIIENYVPAVCLCTLHFKLIALYVVPPAVSLNKYYSLSIICSYPFIFIIYLHIFSIFLFIMFFFFFSFLFFFYLFYFVLF